MDIAMPLIHGFSTTARPALNNPLARVIAQCVIGDEQSVIRMMRKGTRECLLKESVG